MTNYAGIDYSLGQSNVDKNTGIHYGVISQNSLMPEATNDFEPFYGDPHCPECGNAVLEASDKSLPDDSESWEDEEHGCNDYACVSCKHFWDSGNCFPDESQGFTYEREGYSSVPCFERIGPLFPNRPALSQLLLGGPGHDGYAYNADVYCVDCGQDIIRDLYRDGAYNDGDSGDTGEFPQPIFFGESPDYAQHCGECLEYLYGPQDEDSDDSDDDENGLDQYGNER